MIELNYEAAKEQAGSAPTEDASDVGLTGTAAR
jgi:hypothetical protein